MKTLMLIFLVDLDILQHYRPAKAKRNSWRSTENVKIDWKID